MFIWLTVSPGHTNDINQRVARAIHCDVQPKIYRKARSGKPTKNKTEKSRLMDFDFRCMKIFWQLINMCIIYIYIFFQVERQCRAPIGAVPVFVFFFFLVTSPAEKKLKLLIAGAWISHNALTKRKRKKVSSAWHAFTWNVVWAVDTVEAARWIIITWNNQLINWSTRSRSCAQMFDSDFASEI